MQWSITHRAVITLLDYYYLIFAHIKFLPKVLYFMQDECGKVHKV